MEFIDIQEIAAPCGLAIFVEDRQSLATESVRCINSFFRFGPAPSARPRARAGASDRPTADVKRFDQELME